MGFLTIYVVAIVIIGAIVISINIRLIRREKNDSADPAAKTSSAEGQLDETVSEPRQNTVTKSSRPSEVPKAGPHQEVPSSVQDEALPPAKRAAATAPTPSTPIFQQRSQQAPLKQAARTATVRPVEALDELKRDAFKMTDDDYRNALRHLSGLDTPDKTPELDEELMVTSDDAYREALRSMMNKKQDSC